MNKIILVIFSLFVLSSCQALGSLNNSNVDSANTTPPPVETDEMITAVLHQQVKALGNAEYSAYLDTFDPSSIEFPKQKSAVDQFKDLDITYKIKLSNIEIVERNETQALVRFNIDSFKFSGKRLVEVFESEEEFLLRKVHEQWKVFTTKVLRKKYVKREAQDTQPPLPENPLASLDQLPI